MPEWLAAITWGETVIFLASFLALAGVVKKLWKPVKSFGSFLNDWNGQEEVKDASDTVIKKKVLGVLAQIEDLRGQLQNSHQDAENPNLRDDLDTKASKDDVAKVAALVESLVSKLDQHITISKDYDEAQETTARKLNEHTEQTAKWTEMLTDMRGTWSKNQRLPPEETNL